MSTAEVRRYWDRVARLPCLISGGPAEICHCHGGSMVPLMGPHAKGKKLDRFDWLVLPLAPHYHRVEYGGLDADVEAWEALYGAQVAHLNRLIGILGVNVWDKAGLGMLGIMDFYVERTARIIVERPLTGRWGPDTPEWP